MHNSSVNFDDTKQGIEMRYLLNNPALYFFVALILFTACRQDRAHLS